ncbi:MAG TPA: MFS transporter [Anaerolineales bacterium]|nr:MFS transporter [Anaerolineales bacterium]
MAFVVTRTVLNTMHRMVYPFLPAIGRGLGVDLAALSLALTLRSLIGVFGPVMASVADSRGRKAGMLLGLVMFTLGVTLVAIWPIYPVFLLTLSLALLGKYIFDPAMQAYLGDRVLYQRRGLVLAVTELGWSSSFIAGVPIMGLLITRFGWSGPFPVLAFLGLLVVGLLGWMLPRDPAPADGRPGMLANFRSVLNYRPALMGLWMGLLLSAANEVVNLVFGVWMEDAFGLKIAALGAASAVIGLSELGGESLAGGLTDRLGKPLALSAGILLNCLAALALPFMGQTLFGALAGLFLFYITFEFTLVSSIPLMTEILPSARATLMAGNVAALSLGRALGALIASPLYAMGLPDLLPAFMPNVLAAVLFNLLALTALSRLLIEMRKRQAS